MIVHIEDMADMNAKLAEADENLAILVFSASWCGPCKMMGPKVDEAGKQYPDVLIIKIDVDEFEDIAAEYSVVSMPTFVFIRNQRIITTFSGANNEKFRSVLEENATAKVKK